MQLGKDDGTLDSVCPCAHALLSAISLVPWWSIVATYQKFARIVHYTGLICSVLRQWVCDFTNVQLTERPYMYLAFLFTSSGHLPPKERVSLWESRRVFFLTPQVMQNDLSRGTCPAHLVCCVVFDEAHKALGNHAYCQVGGAQNTTGMTFFLHILLKYALLSLPWKGVSEQNLRKPLE